MNNGTARAGPQYYIGFWSALLTAALAVWWFIAFALYQPILHAPWHGLPAYADSFQSAPFVAWVVPCLALGPVFLTMVACIHASTGAPRQVWSLLALVFAVVYAALLSATYYIQLAVVRPNLLRGSTEGLSLWLYAPPYPRSIPGALEGIGFFFMCGSFLFSAQVFRGEALDRWTRLAFLGTGITGRIVFTDPLFPLPLMLTLADAFVNAVFFVAAPILLAIRFRRTRPRSPAT